MLQKSYEQLEMWEEYLEYMQYQLSAVSPDEKQQVMYYCLGMGKCLLNLGRNQEALEQYETWHSMYKNRRPVCHRMSAAI